MFQLILVQHFLDATKSHMYLDSCDYSQLDFASGTKGIQSHILLASVWDMAVSINLLTFDLHSFEKLEMKVLSN